MCRTDAEGPGALLRAFGCKRPHPASGSAAAESAASTKAAAAANPAPREPPPERPPCRRESPARAEAAAHGRTRPRGRGGRGRWNWPKIKAGRHRAGAACPGDQVAPPVAAVAPAVGGAHHDHHQEDQQKQPHLSDHSEHIVILLLGSIDRLYFLTGNRSFQSNSSHTSHRRRRKRRGWRCRILRRRSRRKSPPPASPRFLRPGGSSMPEPAMAHTLFSPTAYTSRKPLFRLSSPMPPSSPPRPGVVGGIHAVRIKSTDTTAIPAPPGVLKRETGFVDDVLLGLAAEHVRLVRHIAGGGGLPPRPGLPVRRAAPSRAAASCRLMPLAPLIGRSPPGAQR